MIFCLVLTALFLLLLGKYRRYGRDFLEKEGRKKEQLPAPLLSLGLFLSDRFREKKNRSIQETRYEDLLLRREAEIRCEGARTFAKSCLVLFSGLLLAIPAFLMNSGDGAVEELARPAFGQEKVFSLKALINGEEEQLSVSVSGRDPEGAELERELDSAFESLTEECLGDNTSLSEVSHSLEFPSENDRGIRFFYESSAPELLSDYGTLLASELPDEGIGLSVTVTAVYGGMEKAYELQIRLVPREEQLSPLEQVKQAIQKADEDSLTEEKLVLPAQVEEYTVVYSEERSSPWLIPGAALAAAVLIFFLPAEKEKEKRKDREKELAISYPQLLSKLNTLIHAGMSIRNAFQRIAGEYREEREHSGRKKEYAYEEVSLTVLRLEQGENEREAYEEFGRRCTLRNYRKLGNLLGQNLRQGISGLEGALEEEMDRALEDRKNAALRAGEEAGTRLLFPMILMLLIVVTVLVVPAFLSF